MCIFSCSRSRMSLNGAKCNILLCDTKVHVCWLCSVIHCVVLSVPLGMSLGWDVDFQSNTMISYFYLTPPPFSWFYLLFGELVTLVSYPPSIFWFWLYCISILYIYSPTCLKQAAKGNTKIACLRQVLA